ncbi:MAG: protein kinase [Chitinivibrionales bacterium]|nr:protein kinase [Chitinivibrionales bacterium]
MALSLVDYKDIRELARGGMGKVYLATQVSLNREVVIKEMAAGLVADESQIKRFENEAMAGAALSHPNVIRIYDFGRDRDSFYISMEYILGPSLQELIERGDIPREVCLMVLLQALKGLQYAHTQNIIHRDVKPGNILVDSATGQAKILDFGLAYAGSRALHLTATDSIVGTPQYMSPEQANGVEQKDARMDIFSVGVLTYQIITGTLPFQGNTIPAVLYSITQTKEKDIQELVPWLPDELADNVRFALEKDINRRLPSLGTLIDSLQNLFFDMGIRDPVDTVRQALANSEQGAAALYEKLLDYHIVKAERFARSGDQEKAKGHATQALRYNPGDKQAIEVLRSLQGGTTVLRAVRKEARTPEAALLARNRPSHHRLRVALVSAALVLVLAALNWFGYRMWRASERQTAATAPSPDSLAPEPKPTPSTPVRPSQPVRRVPIKRAPPAPKPAPRPAPKKVNWGTLKVTVEPKSATVTIDGKRIHGSDGVHIKRLLRGKHTVRVDAASYDAYQRVVTIEAGGTQLLDVVLKGDLPRTGQLHVHTYPWAELFVNGRFKGNTPTAPALELDPGRHAVVLRREGYETYETIVEVKPGETTRTKVRLQPLASAGQ